MQDFRFLLILSNKTENIKDHFLSLSRWNGWNYSLSRTYLSRSYWYVSWCFQGYLPRNCTLIIKEPHFVQAYEHTCSLYVPWLLRTRAGSIYLKKNTNELFNLVSPGKLPGTSYWILWGRFFFKVSIPFEEKLVLDALGLVSVLTGRLSFFPSVTNCVVLAQSRTSSNGQRKHRHFKLYSLLKN